MCYRYLLSLHSAYWCMFAVRSDACIFGIIICWTFIFAEWKQNILADLLMNASILCVVCYRFAKGGL